MKLLFAGFALAACFAQDQKYTMIVTGTYAPTSPEDVNRNVEVIDLGQSRALFGGLYDVLQDDSSIDLRERQPGDIQADISLRGGTSGQTLILLNGIRLSDPQTSHFNLDLPVPMQAIDQVQILHGSGSTQYGSDAVTGVVNLLARPARPELRLRSALGNFGVNQESASMAAGGKRWSEQIVVGRDFSSGFRADRDYRNLSLLSMTHAGRSDILLSLSDRPFGADQFYGNFNSWERTKGWLASLRQELGRDTQAHFAYRRHTDLFVLFRDRPDVFTNRHVVQGWQGDLRRAQKLTAGQKLFHGVEAYADEIDSNNLGYHSRVRGAGYLAYEAQWRKRYTISAGVRDEIYGSFNNDVSPTASAGMWLSPRWKLRAAVGRAFRLPTYTDLYYHDPANAGSPNLRPETAWNYEGGADWRPSLRVRASATVFQRRDSNLIDYVQASPGDLYRAANILKLTFTGVESSLRVRIAAAQEVKAQFTELRASEAPLPGVVSRYAFNYARHNGVIAWQGTLGSMLVGRTRVRVLERYAQKVYAVWDASLARSSGRLRPFLQFTNLTNTSYQEIPGVAMPGRGIVGGMELWIYERK